jgi:hypothetical protein
VRHLSLLVFRLWQARPKKALRLKKVNLRRSLVKKSPAEQEQRIAELCQQLAESLQQKSATVSENVRLSKELEDRNRQLAEAFEQQTATSDILAVIMARQLSCSRYLIRSRSIR